MTPLAWGCLAGWLVVLILAWVAAGLRRRLELVAQAGHELRGPVTAFGFAVAALRRDEGGLRRALAFEAELERMRVGLADLEAARSGRRSQLRPVPVGVEGLARKAAAGWRPAANSSGRRLSFRWEGGPATVRADPGRLEQALGNLLANAVEHGSGPVELIACRNASSVRVEVRNAAGRGVKRVPVARAPDGERGMGLIIAGQAVEDAGGRLTIKRGPKGGTVARVELPVAEP